MPVTNITLVNEDPNFEIHEEECEEDDEGDDEITLPPPPAPADLERLKTVQLFDEQWEDWQWTGDPSAGVAMVSMVPMVQMVPIAPMPLPPYMTNSVGPTPQSMPPHMDPVMVGGGPPASADGPPAGAPPMPQTLQRSTSVSSRATRIEWIVDSRKLRGNDKQAVSPSFDLTCGGRQLPFKMMIYPKQVTEQKGGASFKKSKGRGSVTIKCEADVHHGSTPLKFRIYTGQGTSKQPPRGPVEHDFSASAVCMLPRNIEEWDFQEVVDRASGVFVVGLEVLTQ